MVIKTYRKNIFSTGELTQIPFKEFLDKTGLTQEQVLILTLANEGHFYYGMYEIMGCAD